MQGNEMTIGREDDNDLTLATTQVSRNHAKITYDGQTYQVVDLNSTNGTFVDGRRIRRHELQPGETIELGGTRIEYVLEDDAYDAELAASRRARH